MNILDLFESPIPCPHCGGPAFSDLVLAEKKDACYHKVRGRYKVWPSAYASGALVQCRKKGAKNWGNKSESIAEGFASPEQEAQVRARLKELEDLDPANYIQIVAREFGMSEDELRNALYDEGVAESPEDRRQWSKKELEQLRMAGKEIFAMFPDEDEPNPEMQKFVKKQIKSRPMAGPKGVLPEQVDIGREWMSDTELDQYVPDELEKEWRELVGYDFEGKAHPLWINLTGDYEPDINDPQHRKWMVDVANKWFAMKKISNVKFFDVKDATDELEWLVQIGQQSVAEGLGDTKTEVIGKYKGWTFAIETQEEDDRYVTFYGAVSPDGKWHSLPKRASAEQFKQFVDNQGVAEAYDPWDEGDMWYKFDSMSGTLKQRSWKHAQERQAVAAGWSTTQEQALRQAGIIRSKFNPKKFVQKQGGKWVEVFPYGKGQPTQTTTKNPGQDVTEASSPAQQAAIAIAMKKAGKQPKNESVDNENPRPKIRKYKVLRPDGTQAVRYEVLNYRGVLAQGGFDDLKYAREYALRNYEKLSAPLEEANVNPTDTVKMDVPLLLRVMEYSKEDAKTDMDLHDVVTNLVDLSKTGETLTMKDYDQAVGPDTDSEYQTKVVETGRYWCSTDKRWKDR